MYPSFGEEKIENVVFIISDDLKASVLGSYGDEVCHTPNIDRLAEEAQGYLGSLRSKESALKFVEREVEQLKAMFDEKERRLAHPP